MRLLQYQHKAEALQSLAAPAVVYPSTYDTPPTRKRRTFLSDSSTQVLPNIAPLATFVDYENDVIRRKRLTGNGVPVLQQNIVVPPLNTFVDYRNDVIRRVRRVFTYEETPLIESCAVDQSQPTAGDFMVLGLNSDNIIAQSFSPRFNSNACKITLLLGKEGNPTDNVTVSLYKNIIPLPGENSAFGDGNFNEGQLVATTTTVCKASQLPQIAFLDEMVLVDFQFIGVNLIANDSYYFKIERTGAASGINHYYVGLRDGVGNGTYLRGTCYLQVSAGSYESVKYRDIVFYQWYYPDTAILGLESIPQLAMPEYSFRRKKPWYAYPTLATYENTVASPPAEDLRVYTLNPQYINRHKDRRSIYPYHFTFEKPIPVALQRVYPEYPARPVRHKDRRSIYPFVADFERSFPARDLRAYSTHPDYVWRHKDPRYRMPAYFRYEDVIIQYASCIPFTIWAALDNQTTSWTDQPTTPETTAWADLDNQTTMWEDTCYTDE